MKKHFEKQGQIDGEIIMMISRKGFVDLFWEKYTAALKEDPGARREDVFDEMNMKYLQAIGELRYNSYESFRRRLK